MELVGYVPLTKIPQVRCAMDENKISNMTLQTSSHVFNQDVPVTGWYSKVILAKSGPWGHKTTTNRKTHFYFFFGKNAFLSPISSDFG